MRLAGRRIVNTRAAQQAATLNALLRAEGALPLPYPAIAIVPPEDSAPLDQALGGSYDLLVLTSANAAESVAARLKLLGAEAAWKATVAVGEATARAAQKLFGGETITMTDVQNARALGEALPVRRGMRILLPQSALAQAALAERMTARGADVTAVTAYQTVRGSGGVELAPLLRAGALDAVTFISASGVRFFRKRLDAEGGEYGQVRAACLSRQIGQLAQAQGFTVVAEAETPSLDSLITALADYFAEKA